MFGWPDVQPTGRIKCVSVKTQPDSTASEFIVVGTFTFKHVANFRQMIERLILRDAHINVEFYIDSV
jgi:hypothetical protein